MKRKNYKCTDCGFTCWIQIIKNGAVPLPRNARNHLFYAEHHGFIPLKEENKK